MRAERKIRLAHVDCPGARIWSLRVMCAKGRGSGKWTRTGHRGGVHLNKNYTQWAKKQHTQLFSPEKCGSS